MTVLEKFSLAGKVALVTGGSRGLGRAMAQALGEAGAAVALVARGLDAASQAADDLAGQGIRAIAVQADITDTAQVDRMVETVTNDLGRIDVLVNNAGIYRAAATLDVSEDHWDAIMTINAKAVFFATQAVLPVMIAQKSGAIVNLASMAGKIGSKTNLPYNASKAAVVSMTKSLALAHAADGIRVNCVCPGFVETDMWTMVARDQGALLGMTADEFTRQRRAQVPLGRMEKPEDVASVIGFLASPRAGYMTGQALSVDGGLVMH
jgi:3-oxoacyl-[acyl-carrier protein] reductase